MSILGWFRFYSASENFRSPRGTRVICQARNRNGRLGTFIRDGRERSTAFQLLSNWTVFPSYTVGPRVLTLRGTISPSAVYNGGKATVIGAVQRMPKG